MKGVFWHSEYECFYSMKVLIVINDLGSGGAQKSLVSFLTCLSEKNQLKDYEIDLLVSNKSGIFLERVPKDVNLLNTDAKLVWMNCPLNNRSLRKSATFSSIILKIKWIVIYRYNKKNGNYYAGKTLWESWKKYIAYNDKEYDVAISYMDGWPNYYVMEKVQARKKVLWIHNEYQKLGYDSTYDLNFYMQCDEIITISKKCKLSFIETFPQLTKKIHVLENISLASNIIRRSEEFSPEEFYNDGKQRIVSVGRLCEQKGFDIAIEAAKSLKQRGVSFIWYILGDGPEKNKLMSLIKTYGLDNDVLLLGIKSNPYPYISQADIFVQTSKFEGKSIVLDEAKILLKPIIVTNYDTVYDSIINEETGIVVAMDGEAVANGIYRLLNDYNLRQKLIQNLQKVGCGNEEELKKYIDIML